MLFRSQQGADHLLPSYLLPWLRHDPQMLIPLLFLPRDARALESVVSKSGRTYVSDELLFPAISGMREWNREMGDLLLIILVPAARPRGLPNLLRRCSGEGPVSTVAMALSFSFFL